MRLSVAGLHVHLALQINLLWQLVSYLHFFCVPLEVRCSPTKPCGKGSKRKQDDLDEDEELEQPSWVEALTQELTDEDQSADPDYEVCPS